MNKLAEIEELLRDEVHLLGGTSSDDEDDKPRPAATLYEECRALEAGQDSRTEVAGWKLCIRRLIFAPASTPDMLIEKLSLRVFEELLRKFDHRKPRYTISTLTHPVVHLEIALEGGEG